MASTKNTKTTNTTETTATTRTRKRTNLREITNVVNALRDYVTNNCRENMEEVKHYPPDSEVVEEAKIMCANEISDMGACTNKLYELALETPKLNEQAEQTGFFEFLDTLPPELEGYWKAGKEAEERARARRNGWI